MNHISFEKEIQGSKDRYQIQKKRCIKNMYFLYKLTIQAFLRYLIPGKERKVVKEHGRDTPPLSFNLKRQGSASPSRTFFLTRLVDKEPKIYEIYSLFL